MHPLKHVRTEGRNLVRNLAACDVQKQFLPLRLRLLLVRLQKLHPSEPGKRY